MPLGISRLTSLSRYVAAAPSGPSRTPASVTLYNNSYISTSQYKFGTSSLYINGTDERAVTDVTLPLTGDFTLEFWVRPTEYTGPRAYGSQYIQGDAGRLIIIASGELPRIQVGSTLTTGSNNVLTLDNWHHIAVTRTGSTFKMYVDGTLEVTHTNSASLADTTWMFGGYPSSATAMGYDCKGWFDEVRISDTVRYTANFTPPTAAFTDDANTLMLLHCEGANLSTEVKDDVGADTQLYRYDPYADYLQLAVTFDDTVGGTGTTDVAHLINTSLTGAKTKTQGSSSTIQGTDYYWGATDANSIDYEGGEQNSRAGAALTYDLSSNGGTAIPAASSGTYVIEGWFKATDSGTNQNWCLSSADQGSRWLFGFNTGSTVAYQAENKIGIGTAWCHIAIVCDGGTHRFYKNGLLVSTGNWYSVNTGFSTLHVGQFNATDSNDFLGYMQDLRVYVGTNKGYTGTSTTAANFLVPESISERWT